MKLESLKSDKFNGLQKYSITNTGLVRGGDTIGTEIHKDMCRTTSGGGTKILIDGTKYTYSSDTIFTDGNGKEVGREYYK